MNKYYKMVFGERTADKIFFRVNHPAYPTTLFGFISLMLVYWAQLENQYSLWVLISAFAAGLLLWTLTEYCLHRFLFHWTSVGEPWKTIFSGLHMAHHRDTKDTTLIMAPPTVGVIYSTLIYFLLWGITQSWGISAIILAGLYTGYICYEWVHYGAHEYNWNHGFLNYLKRYHISHHFKHPNEDFGVTSPLWDKVLGTYK